MKRPPKLCHHKKRGYAFVYVGTKQVYLGRWGSSEAQAAYDRFLLKWAKSNQETEHPRQTDDYLLAEVVCAFLEDYERRPVQNKSDLNTFRLLSRRIGKLFPRHRADDFRISDLETLRDSFQQKGFDRKGKHQEYTRTYLNKLINRTKTIFSWGVAKEMVSAETAARLKYLPPLRKGRTTASEPSPKHLIPDADYKAACAFLSPYYRDVVEILRLTGMRPSELANMRVCDIDRSKSVWFYSPKHHKTEHSGGIRSVALGKKAQTILRKHLKERKQDEYVFTTVRAMESKWKNDRERRKTPLTPSQKARDEERKNRLEKFRNQLDPVIIGRRVRAACDKAIEAGKLSRPWTPYELRHTAITNVRTKFGAEVAQHFAGHSNLDTQKFYDHSAQMAAEKVAREIG